MNSELEQIQSILDMSTDAVALLKDGNIEMVNNAFKLMLGYSTEDDIVGKRFQEFIHPSRWNISRELVVRMQTDQKSLYSVEDVYQTKDGDWIPVEVRSAGILVGEDFYYCIFARNINTWKKYEVQLYDYEARLSQLSSELIIAEENTRRNLALALHDQIAHNLAITKMQIDNLKAQMDTPSTADSLMAIEDLVEDTIKQSRTLMYDLSPPILHDLGLTEAIAWLCEKFDERTGLQVRFENDNLEEEPRSEFKIMLFRSVQELFNNVEKHARASMVEVILNVTIDVLTLSVADDGVGFDLENLNTSPDEQGRFGLFSIKDRIEYLGGAVEIIPVIDKGTLVRLYLPLTEGSP